jgi:DNA polymerase/3'-5' exonuclease PolX
VCWMPGQRMRLIKDQKAKAMMDEVRDEVRVEEANLKPGQTELPLAGERRRWRSTVAR